MYKVLMVVLAGLLIAACGDSAKQAPEAIRLVKVIEVTAQAPLSVLRLAGTVRARYESPLAFQVGGKIIERNLNLGEPVKAGQVLARLEATDYDLAAGAASAAVTAAHADLALAEAELKRYRSLVDKGLVSVTVLDQKQTAADAARARYKAAQAEASAAGRQVDYTLLKADTDGVVTALDMNVGQVVAAGQNVAQLARAGNREIEINVPEADLARVRAAQRFTITLNAQAENQFSGMLREIAATANPLTRTYVARIAIDDAALPESLQLGMSATVSDVQNASTVLRLPLAAIVSRDGNPQVWKWDATSSTVHAVAVRTGTLDGNQVVIESGISAGDVIITAGAHLLREGQEVRALR